MQDLTPPLSAGHIGNRIDNMPIAAEFWLNLQAHHDLVHAREALADRLVEIMPLAMVA